MKRWVWFSQLKDDSLSMQPIRLMAPQRLKIMQVFKKQEQVYTMLFILYTFIQTDPKRAVLHDAQDTNKRKWTEQPSKHI